MVLVSIVPFRPRRILFWLPPFPRFPLLLALPIHFSSPPKTPYDHQMARIQPVLNAPTSLHHSVLPLSLVNQWIGELRAIPYSYSMEWKTPNEIAHAPTADCKGKQSHFIKECEKMVRVICVWLSANALQ